MARFVVVQYGSNSPSPAKGAQLVISIFGQIEGDQLKLTGRKPDGSSFKGEASNYRVLKVNEDCRTRLDGFPQEMVRGVQGVGGPEITVEVALDDVPIQSFCIVREVAPDMQGYDPFNPGQKVHFRSLWVVVERVQ